MIQEIKYTGFTAQPSDYECPDGELDAAINLVPEDGELKPVEKGEAVLQLPEDCIRVALIHTANAISIIHENYVYEYEDGTEHGYKYFDALNEGVQGTIDSSLEDVINISAIGNVLVFSTKNGCIYYYWKEESGYSKLGSKIPECQLSFGLVGHPLSTAKIIYTEESYRNRELFINYEFGETISQQITDGVLGLMQETLSSRVYEKGRFAMPFLVRYALRLYDGTLVNHSAPILMTPGTKANLIPYVCELYWQGEGDEADHDNPTSINAVTTGLFCVASDLTYSLTPGISESFAGWEDIVKSVDIFVSAPIYTFDSDGKIKRISKNSTIFIDSSFIGKLTNNDDFSDTLEKSYFNPSTGQIEYRTVQEQISQNVAIQNQIDREFIEVRYDMIWRMYDGNTSANESKPILVGTYTPDGYPNLIMSPQRDKDAIDEDIRNTKNFYLIKSIPINELSSTTAKIVLSKETLQSLTSREVMTDGYMSHSIVFPQKTFSYNERLIFGNVVQIPCGSFPLSSMLARSTAKMGFGLQNNTNNPVIWKYTGGRKTSIEVFIKKNGSTYSVMYDGRNDIYLRNPLFEEPQDTSIYPQSEWGRYFFYPDSEAYMMRLYVHDTQNDSYAEKYDFNLKPHDFLNGAYVLLDTGEKRNQTHTQEHVVFPEEPPRIYLRNKVILFNVDNPFVFDAKDVFSVGTGEIVGLSSTTKALSQGQFGQFPLYAFTTEGVWALEVSSDGTFNARQPVTRDVCNNPDSITQLDNAVLFATDRGIMLLSGSDSICITDSINSDTVFKLITADTEDNADLLPGLDKLASSNDGIATAADIVPFKMFLPSARMLYDYTHQRIIVYNPEHTYAYVYSLKSKSWGMMQSNIKYGINSYPECLAIDNDNNIINLSGVPEVLTENAEASTRSCLLITRPLKFDQPDVLKTIDTVIQRGQFRKGSVQSILYGSRDLFHWHLVASSRDHYLRGFRGTPYKYFRIVLLANLQKDESIFGCTIGYAPRLLDQLR